MHFKNIHGKIIKAPKGDYAWRPVVYGILIEDGKLLCQRPLWDKRKYSLPGGAMKKGESYDEALKREFLEETGCKIKVLPQPIYSDTELFGNPENNIYFQRVSAYFNVELISRNKKRKLDKETTALFFVDIDNLNSNDFTAFQRKALKDILKK